MLWVWGTFFWPVRWELPDMNGRFTRVFRERSLVCCALPFRLVTFNPDCTVRRPSCWIYSSTGECTDSVHICDAMLAVEANSRCSLLCPHISPGRHERPVFLVLRCPKLQPAVSGRRSALLPAAGLQLRHKVSFIRNKQAVFVVLRCHGCSPLRHCTYLIYFI